MTKRYAYGIAVTGTFATTTLLFFVVIQRRWRLPPAVTIAGAAIFIT